MLAYVKTALFKRLAALSFAASCGAVAPSSDLFEIPVGVIDELVAEGLCTELGQEDQKNVVGLLAADPRPSVRSTAAEAIPALAAVSLSDAEDVIRPLSKDDSPSVRTAAAAALARVLAVTPPLDRVDLMTRWTLARPAPERQAIARALGSPVPVGGVELALMHLTGDPEPAVRHSALEAGSLRFSAHPELIEELAAPLVVDPDRHVRRLARRTLVEARRVG